MTIFDILERLETEVVSLCAQNQELRLGLNLQSSKSGSPRLKKPARTAKKKAKRKRVAAAKKFKAAGARSANGAGEQMDLPALADSGDPPKEVRSVGKRQALGKSLAQLRKVAAPRQL